MSRSPTTIAEARHPNENKLSFVKEQRIGRIEMTMEFIECARGDVWDILMRNVRIIEAKYDVFRQTVVYDCYSPWFDINEGGMISPTYTINFERDEVTGDITITGVNKVVVHTDHVTDDNVLERLKRTIREQSKTPL